MKRTLILLAVLSTLAFPRSAAADILLTPFAGVSFLDEGGNKLSYGVGLALGGLIGIEGEIARTKLGDVELLGDVVDLGANVTTGMVNMVVRFPAGPIQPYGTAGVGLIRASGDVEVPFFGSVFSVSGRTMGLNYGGGVYLFPSPNIGIRGDVRYFRTVGDLDLEDVDDILGFDLPVPDFDFWRVTGGVTIRF